MTHPQSSILTRFRLWWEEADAILAQHGQKPLDYEEANTLFSCEVELQDVREALSGVRLTASDRGRPPPRSGESLQAAVFNGETTQC